ncbi:MAG: zinc-binding alcohol dehydrogenase family protein [Blautia sp.]|jgi:2-desacetyl-2-hydroxyethyl bacteriochlorophyllide A dehydrogenase
MKAILVEQPGQVRLIEKEMPVLRTDTDVLVKMTAVGVCGSDIHILHGTHPYVQYPRIIGHEGAGMVMEVGKGVADLQKGDGVVIEPIQYCGECYACRKGRHNVCEKLRVTGVHDDGTYQEYMVLDRKQLHKYSRELTPAEAVAAEPYTIGAQANARAGTAKGDFVLIHGAGPIGLITCDLAAALGAVCMVSEPNESRLEMAKAFGAKYVIRPDKEDLKARLMEITGGMGANIIFEAAGVPKLLEDSLELASAAGTIIPMTFGDKPIPLNFGLVNKKELTIGGTRMECGRFPAVLESFPGRKDRLDRLVTHTFSLEEYEKAFATFVDKTSGSCKVIMVME